MSDDLIRRAVVVIMATVVGLTFLFGFGNVLSLGLRLGVPVWVAPLVAPAVDLSVLGLLIGLRQLATTGATPDQLRPARRLLLFCSLVTLALNMADPIIAGEYGKAAFDAVGPLLLIGWADVGPTLLTRMSAPTPVGNEEVVSVVEELPTNRLADDAAAPAVVQDELLERARREDIRHRELHHRPISAEALRQRLHVGSARARRLVSAVRSKEWSGVEPVLAKA